MEIYKHIIVFQISSDFIFIIFCIVV